MCSLHFKQEDFKEDTKYRKLKNLSIPSIFPGYPSYKKPSNKRKRKVRNSSSSFSEKNNVSRLAAQCQEDIEAEYREKDIEAEIIKDKADVNVYSRHIAVQVNTVRLSELEYHKKLNKNLRAKVYRLENKIVEIEKELQEAKEEINSYTETKSVKGKR